MSTLSIDTEDLQSSMLNMFNEVVNAYRTQVETTRMLKKIIAKNNKHKKKISSLILSSKMNLSEDELKMLHNKFSTTYSFLENSIFIGEKMNFPNTHYFIEYMNSIKELKESMEDILDTIEILLDKPLLKSINKTTQGDYSDFVTFK